jgi:hypothetical protein
MLILGLVPHRTVLPSFFLNWKKEFLSTVALLTTLELTECSIIIKPESITPPRCSIPASNSLLSGCTSDVSLLYSYSIITHIIFSITKANKRISTLHIGIDSIFHFLTVTEPPPSIQLRRLAADCAVVHLNNFYFLKD